MQTRTRRASYNIVIESDVFSHDSATELEPDVLSYNSAYKLELDMFSHNSATELEPDMLSHNSATDTVVLSKDNNKNTRLGPR